MYLTSYDDPVKDAIKKIHESGYTFGSVIPEAFFLKRFRIVPAKTAEEQKKNQIMYADYMGRLRSKLLHDSKFLLVTKPGVGQEIVKPQDQTEYSCSEFKKDMSKLYRKTLDRLTNIDIASLSDIEKKENLDAIAKLSFFSNRRIKRLGW